MLLHLWQSPAPQTQGSAGARSGQAAPQGTRGDLRGLALEGEL